MRHFDPVFSMKSNSHFALDSIAHEQFCSPVMKRYVLISAIAKKIVEKQAASF
jgi:hypothetical protein